MAVTSWIRGTTAISNDFNDYQDIQDGNSGVATSKVLTPTGEFIFLQGFDFQVPTASLINGIEIRTLASKQPSGGSITVGVTASFIGQSQGEEFATDTFTISNNDSQTYLVGGENEMAGPLHLLNYNNVNNLRIRWETLINPDSKELAITGSTVSTVPAVRIHYTPLRWARVLTSGSNFPVTTLTSSTFDEIPASDVVSYGITTVNSSGHFLRTGSIAFSNYITKQPEFKPSKGLGDNFNSQSLYVSGATISASNIPNQITIPDSGDFRSDVLWHRIQDGVKPKGRISKNPTIAVENVLTYVGGKNASINTNLKSASYNAPFIPFSGERTEGTITNLPGDAIGLTGPNSGDVGYADYNKNQNYIFIERTSPQQGPSSDYQFYITASFAIPYSSSYGDPAGLKAYIVQKVIEENDAFVSPSIDLNIGTFYNTPQIGMFTGSFVIPGFSANNILRQNDQIQLRIQNQNDSRPVHVGFTGSGATATFELEGEFNKGLRPTFYFDVELDGEFVGEAWSNYSGSLTGIITNPWSSANSLYNGNGLLFLRGGGFPPGYVTYFDGSTPVTASIKLAGADRTGAINSGVNTTGLTFARYSDPSNQMSMADVVAGQFLAHSEVGEGSNQSALALTASLPGNGLTFTNPSGDFSSILVELSGPSDVTSGLKLDSNGLAIRDSIGGAGLKLTSGVLNIDLFRSSPPGLEIIDGKLAVTESLPGYGLSFDGVNRNIINAIFTDVITSSYAITASVPGDPNPDGPLFVGNVAASSTIPSYEMKYSYIAPGNSITYQYGFLTAMFHPTLSSISGSTLSLKGDVTLGNNVKTQTVYLNYSQLNLSSSFPQLNYATSYVAPPQSYKRGGLIIPTEPTKTDTGSSIFYDSAVNGNPFSNWDYEELDSAGWILTTGSSVIKQGTENTNPFDPNSVNSNPTSSFTHNDFTAPILTAKLINSPSYGGITDPNDLSLTSSLYETASVVNYGAICVINILGSPTDSNVWMYVPESTL